MDEQELAGRYGFNLETLKKEQIKLGKTLELKDSKDLSSATKYGAIGNIIVTNQIISAIIVCDKNFEILEQQYFQDKLRFPYLHEFRSYRELPSMVEAYNKLNEKPDIIFIKGHGTTHPRLGLASHFSLVTGVPTIGIAEELFEIDKISSEESQEIMQGDKKVGKVLISKEGSNPLYISPGNRITIETAWQITKKFIKQPHKLPEPLHMALKYAREVKDELNL